MTQRTTTTATVTSLARGSISGRFRPCDDCTCSPGLLSRQGRRASLFLRQIESSRRKTHSHSHSRHSISGGMDNSSIYSSDSLCQSNKEVNTSQRLHALRNQMAKHDLACYIVPSEDEHQSEYVAAIDQRRSFISGFSGSAGIACITRDLLNFNENHHEGKSVLSTDGRYFNQGLQELDFNWSLLRQGVDHTTWQEWCIKECQDMSEGLGNKEVKIGVDPKLFSYQQIIQLQNLITNKLIDTNAKVILVPINENLIDVIWKDFEIVPEREKNNLLMLHYEYHGEEFQSKRSRLIESLKEKYAKDIDNASHTFIVVALDEICWLLNLRGSDIEYNPVFNAYLLINDSDETILFCDNSYSNEIELFFSENNIIVKPYTEIWDYLKVYVEQLNAQSSNIDNSIFLPDTSSWQMVRSVEDIPYKIIHSPIDFFKSVKNEIELGNAHRAQVKDAVAIIQYFSWLEQQLVEKEALIDEYKAAEKLVEIRKTQKHFMGNSFETISSTGANAAVIHYAPPRENSSMIDPSKIYLCDTGSQFLEGTTDITRTLHFTKPTQEQMDNYTAVLKGNLAIERLIVPEGTTGYSIDAIARQFLWERGLDYRHGTGHGIGSFLNVHEGPIGIGFKPHLANFPLQVGNIISNEPGYYKDGEYGIRIENDMAIKEAEGLQFGDRKFLKFENITLVPYCKKLINIKMLTIEEIKQINGYHARIWDKLVQFIQPQSITFKWLKEEVKPL
ncbi:putative Xaa-Pro aminopeptidase fra1 [Maudiozyma exigua]|uniref:Xaa-Pro aminopeptidase n=1 Tax=Maudiozyma exigua TaxID=34358 RepID=A0A9P6WDG1_MAUEX|nr:putative Xaa-Pro aminopeptidase fra1 [Kazachstania exigua]